MSDKTRKVPVFETNSFIIGKQIVDIKQLNDEEAEALEQNMGIDSSRGVTVIVLEDGTYIFTLGDDEGNYFSGFGFCVIPEGKLEEDSDIFTEFPKEEEEE